MVRALNSGGEAQSIADIAVFEPTPDTMVEVVKTVVFEDVRKHETLVSKTTENQFFGIFYKLYLNEYYQQFAVDNWEILDFNFRISRGTIRF